jgi:hypothetical protein
VRDVAIRLLTSLGAARARRRRQATVPAAGRCDEHAPRDLARRPAGCSQKAPRLGSERKSSGSENRSFMTSSWLMAKSSCLAFRESPTKTGPKLATRRRGHHTCHSLLSLPSAPHVRVTVRSPWSDTPTVFHKFHFHMTLERKKQTPVCMFLSKRERPTGGKEWTWTRPFARPRPSSTSDDEGGSVVPNSRLITAVIWISRTPMGDTGPLGSTQTTTTATAMRQKTRPPRNQTRAEWEMEWKARRG